MHDNLIYFYLRLLLFVYSLEFLTVQEWNEKSRDWDFYLILIYYFALSFEEKQRFMESGAVRWYGVMLWMIQ